MCCENSRDLVRGRSVQLIRSIVVVSFPLEICNAFAPRSLAVLGATGRVDFVPIAIKKRAAKPIEAFTGVWSGTSLRQPSPLNFSASVMAASDILNKTEVFLCEKVLSQHGKLFVYG